MHAGTDSTDNSGKELSLELINLSPKGALLGFDGGKFPGRNSNTPYRRILIPATSKFTILLNAFGSEVYSSLSKREVENSV